MNTLIKKINNIELPYQAEHVGLELLDFKGPEPEFIRELYIHILSEKKILNFLDDLIAYAKKIISVESLLQEEIYKLYSLLESVHNLPQLGLKFNSLMYEGMINDFKIKRNNDGRFSAIEKDIFGSNLPRWCIGN